MPAGIAYVDGPRLSRSLLAAADWVAAGREEINRINVFPVPDGDTGTNVTLTLRAVADALRALGDAPLPETAGAMARAAVLGARGNSGMMIAHFLVGFTESLGDRTRAAVGDLAAATRRGADRLYAALDEPREGTILTVAREAAGAAERAARDTDDVGEFMRTLLREGEASLARTPQFMAVLREAGVVDAGGKGFVRLLEGVVRHIQGDPILPAGAGTGAEGPAPAAFVEVAAERDYRYCTEAIVRGEQLPPANEVRAALHPFGGSLVAAVIGDILKLHIHTDTPDEVFTFVSRWGRLEQRKADDMRAQHRRLAHGDRRPVAIVADSSADLPDAILDRHGILLVPLQLVIDGRTYRDRLDLKPDDFLQRLASAKELPTTSQPAPAELVRVFRDASDHADEVLGVTVAGALSGTHASAVASVRAAGLDRVRLVDSRTASLGLGLLVLRAAELAESGWGAARIAAELDRIRSQSGMFLTVDRYDNLLRSGRVSRGRAWLGSMLDVKPVLTFNARGAIEPVDRVRGRDRVVQRVLELLEQRLTPRPAAVRFGIAHVAAPEAAERLRTALVAAYHPRECLVAPATPVLATHVGPGAWAVFYQVEDETGSRGE